MPVDAFAVASAFENPTIGGYGSRISARPARLSGTTIDFKFQTARHREQFLPSRHSQRRVEGGEITAHGFAISRPDTPEVCYKFPCPPIRGRRECRAPDAPDSRVCNEWGRAHTR